MTTPSFVPGGLKVRGPVKGELRILQLYPKAMNIYGDWGNTLTLARRAAWHGYEPVLLDYNPGDEFPERVDLVTGGGGQDSGQVAIKDDLEKIAEALRALVEDGCPMLVICGMYQLFGHEFITHEGASIRGLGVLDVTTRGSQTRLIGNIVTESAEFGRIVGYENHSGETTLGPGAEPLGVVKVGMGNNGQDAFEGARYRNVIGTYLHGSLLPKNPRIADFLLAKAAERAHGEFIPEALDDAVELAAQESAAQRPR